jgi:hypothetical protein
MVQFCNVSLEGAYAQSAVAKVLPNGTADKYPIRRKRSIHVRAANDL